MEYPRWIKVGQELDRKRDEDPVQTVREQARAVGEAFEINDGDRIAITVGSRYISNLVGITMAVIDYIKSRGGVPFLVPAMGSHGGATAEGQEKVLEEYGFTEENLGVPILSSMEVVLLGEVDGVPIYLDSNAYRADGIIIINRIKPHQVFKGEIQSGLNKMMALGLGKKKGADAIHNSGRTDNLDRIGDFIISKAPILFGVGILENSFDETREIAVLTPKDFKEYDEKWAKVSRGLLPRIPIRDLDLVLVDEMGKDISGSGMDTNVIGFTRRTDPSGNVAVPLAVFDLTEKSDGNAIGIGLADFTTRRLVEKIDFKKTNINVIATGIYSAGRVPITLESERDIIDVILRKLQTPQKSRIIRLKNTLHLEEFFATEALIPDIQDNESLSCLGNMVETAFDDKGNLILSEC
jgi:hypothetical protein